MSLNKKLFTSAAGLTPSFGVVTYTGNGSTNAVTGLNFQPDFVWLKNRSQNSYAPRIFDSSRGATKRLQSSSTSAESTDSTSLTSFDTGGFTVGSDAYVNNSGDNFVAWCFKANGGTTSSNTDGNITSTVQANTDAGFAIAKVTGSGTTDTFGHGLGTTPEVIIRKNLDATDNWNFYTTLIDGSLDFLKLNLTDAKGDSSYTAPTSTVFTNPGDTNDRIYYSFVSVDGFSKIGTYSGSSSAVTVTTGFQPDFVLIKNVDAVRRWTIFDSKRNDFGSYIDPSDSIAEQTDSEIEISVTSTAFVLPAGANYTINSSGYDYIYMAFKIN